MKMSSMLGARFKETPADCQLDSHKLMIRGGYMKQLTTGIYSLFMPAKRICKKIENIIFQAKESKTLTGSDADVENLIVELLANHTIG